ncbi:MAG: DUF1501 domain-containing protein [Flavobacteriales bacterium]
MKRRDFLRTTSAASAGPLLLGGMPVFANPVNNLLTAWAASSLNDRVLVIVQLHGGNDGLNTVIPVNNYGAYYNVRPNIAIPQSGARKYITLDNSLEDARKVGLHTDMTGAKALYDQGKMALVQNVSYENLNASHFRSRDIWFMGGNYDDYLASGWMGRYLDYYYPNYPAGYPSPDMPDPLALEIGSGLSLAFHKGNGIPVSLGIQDPVAFYNLINSVGTDPLYNFPDNYAGDELRYIAEMEQQGNVYAQRLRDTYLAGNNSSVVYPEIYPHLAPQGSLRNHLAPQLKIVSRLLSGGSRTKIFLCRIGGFDTHANQVLENDTTMGSHAALLYHISSAVQAFHNDLQQLGLGDRVVTATISEFGRRIASNASYGTDHGDAAPLFVFGNCVKGGVFGTNPSATDLQGGNLPMQIDYRQVMTALVMDWLGADVSALQHVAFTEWVDSRLDIIDCKWVGNEEAQKDSPGMSVSPNPSSGTAVVRYKLTESDNYTFTVYSEGGTAVIQRSLAYQTPGNKTLDIDASTWAPGLYYLVIQGSTRRNRAMTKFVVVR